MPATCQCTFSKVTAKSVARKRAGRRRLCLTSRGSRAARRAPRRASPRQLAPLVRASGVPVERAGPPASRRARSSASRMPATSSGATTMPAPVSRIRSRGGTVRRHDGEDRPLGGEVLEDLPREHAAPAAAGLRDQEQQRLRVALELERAAPRRRTGAARAGRRARASRPTRGRRCGSRRRSARRRPSSPDCASASRNGRGSRLPKKLPVCVIRKRSPRLVLEPGEVLEVAAVRDRHAPRRAGSSARASSAIASDTATIASARRATSLATPRSTLLLHADGGALGAAGAGARPSESRRSATHVAPVASFDRRADQVHRARAARS